MVAGDLVVEAQAIAALAGEAGGGTRHELRVSGLEQWSAHFVIVEPAKLQTLHGKHHLNLYLVHQAYRLWHIALLIVAYPRENCKHYLRDLWYSIWAHCAAPGRTVTKICAQGDISKCRLTAKTQRIYISVTKSSNVDFVVFAT